MILYHTTTRKALRGILARGLLARKSRGKLKACWFHTADKTHWAMLHVLVKHGVRVDSIVRVKVRVSKALVKRSREGLFYVPGDVPAACIVSVAPFYLFVGSPVEARENAIR